MKFLRAIFSIKGLLIMVAILIGLLVSTNLFSFTLSDEEIAVAFDSTGYQVTDHYIELEEGKLHYVTVGDAKNPPVLLIHGSPGSWDAFTALITETGLLENYYAIAVDRPGYNKTTLKGKYSMAEQSRFIGPIMEKHCKSGCIVAGHSYGGGLAMQIGVDHQAFTKGVVLIAGTVAAPYQNPRWYNYAVRYTPVQWLISNDLVVSSREMWALGKDLPVLEDKLIEYRKKLIIIQGREDMLVDYRSAEYLKEKARNAHTKLLMKENMNHFIIWSDKDLVMKGLNMIQNGF